MFDLIASNPFIQIALIIAFTVVYMTTYICRMDEKADIRQKEFERVKHNEDRAVTTIEHR